MTENPKAAGRTSPLLIALSWAIVGIPWLWGISQTLNNAAKLFH